MLSLHCGRETTVSSKKSRVTIDRAERKEGQRPGDRSDWSDEYPLTQPKAHGLPELSILPIDSGDTEKLHKR
jgi:hypothetical protein